MGAKIKQVKPVNHSLEDPTITVCLFGEKLHLSHHPLFSYSESEQSSTFSENGKNTIWNTRAKQEVKNEQMVYTEMVKTNNDFNDAQFLSQKEHTMEDWVRNMDVKTAEALPTSLKAFPHYHSVFTQCWVFLLEANSLIEKQTNGTKCN